MQLFEALFLGFVSQSSLLLSGLAVYWVRVPKKVVGVLAGFGAGALISAIAFDLIPEAENLATLESLCGCSWARRSSFVGMLLSKRNTAAKAPEARWASLSAQSSTACRNRSSLAFRSLPVCR